ncbi:hypothetical protein ABZ815_37995, partial [Nonomuraea sp. NPDC047529]
MRKSMLIPGLATVVVLVAGGGAAAYASSLDQSPAPTSSQSSATPSEQAPENEAATPAESADPNEGTQEDAQGQQ